MTRRQMLRHWPFVTLLLAVSCASPRESVSDRFPADISLTRQEQRAILYQSNQARTFATTDTNQDGFVTPDEYLAQDWIHFRRFDFDHDDYLSESEFLAASCPATPPDHVNSCAQRHRRTFRSLDRISPRGKMSRPEYAPRSRQFFRSNDLCRIGRLLPPETYAAIQRREARCPE